MAHTVEDLVIEIADKHSLEDTGYRKLKEVLNDFISELILDERCVGDLLFNYLKLPYNK